MPNEVTKVMTGGLGFDGDDLRAGKNSRPRSALEM